MSFSTKAILTFSIKALLVLLTANVCLLHEVQSEASHFQHALKFVGPVSVLAANVKIPVGRIIEFKREDGVTEGKLDENTEKRIENTEKRIDNLEKQVSYLVSNLQEKGLVPTLTPTSNPTQTTIAPTTSPTANPTQTTIAPTTPTSSPTQETLLGWTLLYSSWIPSYNTVKLPEYVSKRSHVITDGETDIKYTQVYLDCASTGSRVRRVLTFDVVLHKAEPGQSASFKEEYYSDDTCVSGCRPPNTSCVRGPNVSAMCFSDMTAFGSSYRRFIIRPGQIHCARDYGEVGGESDNPALGQYGRVWVRNSKEIPKETELPGKELP